jgi:PAS domain S-box-containing protein
MLLSTVLIQCFFSFPSGENEGASSVVSPGQSEDGAINLVGEGSMHVQANSVAHVQQLIAQQAAGMEQQQQVKQEPQLQQSQQVIMANVLAPTSVYAQSHAIAPTGTPLSLAPATSVLSHRGAVLAPHPGAVSFPPQAVAPVAVAPAHVAAVHQRGNGTVTKRKRVDVPVMAVSAPGALLVQNDPADVAAALQGRGRKKTQVQIDRRRERNRILARRTRLRKKFFFESLQKDVMDLQRENVALKDIVRGNLQGDEGKKILDDCKASEKLPAAVIEACGESMLDQQDFNLVRSIQQSQHCFVITDPSLQDNPIIFASDDFLSLTGYSREDVLGRNCRFLQGTETSQAKVEDISKKIAVGDDVSVTLVNYTADGTPFWNKLFIAALRDAQNNIVNFIGVIVKVASPESGDPEYGKLLPGEQSVDDDDNDLFDECDEQDSSTVALVADETIKAIEGDVDAAVVVASTVMG